MTTITQTQIEINVKSLLKDHPNAKDFIRTLQNETIDQAFQELNEKINDTNRRIDEDFELLSAEIRSLREHIQEKTNPENTEVST